MINKLFGRSPDKGQNASTDNTCDETIDTDNESSTDKIR